MNFDRWSLLSLTAAMLVHTTGVAGTKKASDAGSDRDKKNRPNILVILADDMGYSDPGCYGGELSTPALDRLADEGMRLTQFRNCGMSVCSRLSLLTGKWWPQAEKHFSQTPLLSERLHEVGYKTALIGKWHLPGNPMDRGFDHFFGFLGGFSNHFVGSSDYRLDNEPYDQFDEDYYSADAFSERAVEFIRQTTSEDGDAPFFIYLSYQTPHNPLHAPYEDVMRNRGKYLQGWQKIHDERIRRQKEMGILPKNAEIPSYPQNLPAWESLSPQQQDLEDLRMSVYAAMVERMDCGIAKVLDALDACGVADQTIVLFVSDNGADPFSNTDDAMLKAGKLPGDTMSNWQLGTGWAYASVTPWRLYKISQHGGGITSGAIVRYPGVIKKEGDLCHTAVHFVDVAPTLAQIAGYKTDEKENGESFLPLLEGKSWSREEPMFFQFVDNRAVRTGKWSLVEVDGAGWQLFDVRKDPLECCNLADRYPEVVTRLEEMWRQWWYDQTGQSEYKPISTQNHQHYAPQGDWGSGKLYVPRAMPEHLKHRYEK